jgi:hypothetical protein
MEEGKDKARQGKTKPTRQDETRRDKTRRDETRKGETKTSQDQPQNKDKAITRQVNDDDSKSRFQGHSNYFDVRWKRHSNVQFLGI